LNQLQEKKLEFESTSKNKPEEKTTMEEKRYVKDMEEKKKILKPDVLRGHVDKTARAMPITFRLDMDYDKIVEPSGTSLVPYSGSIPKTSFYELMSYSSSSSGSSGSSTISGSRSSISHSGFSSSRSLPPRSSNGRVEIPLTNELLKLKEKLCQKLKVNPQDLIVYAIEKGSIILYCEYIGDQNKIAQIENAAMDLEDTQQVLFGDFGINLSNIPMSPKWNRVYAPGSPDYWDETFTLTRGGLRYFCPTGWTGFSINVAQNSREFDQKWGEWTIAYMGTYDPVSLLILQTGFNPHLHGLAILDPFPTLRITPSITYAAHKRFAIPQKPRRLTNKWLQFVFQVRVNPKYLRKSRLNPPLYGFPENMLLPGQKHLRIDPNYDNNQILYDLDTTTTPESPLLSNKIICQRIMVRVSDSQFRQHPTSQWWEACKDEYRAVDEPV